MVSASLALSADAAAVLEAFVERRTFSLDEAPDACSLSRSRTRDAVGELIEHGIVSSDADRYTIRFGSQAAIQGLLRARRGSAASAVDSGLIDARAVLDGVLTAAPADRNPRVLKVTDRAQLMRQLDQVGRLTRRDLISLHAGGPPRQETLERAIPADRALLDRGVALRIVFPLGALDADYLREYVERMEALGTEIRFADTLPHRLVVSDGVRALVPLDRSDLTAGALVTGEPLLVGSLRHLAGTLFRRGRRLAEVDERTRAGGPTPMDLRMIAMMSSGVTDELAARRLNISERTFRRHVTSLLDRLGATSRFQAGIRAVERGWI